MRGLNDALPGDMHTARANQQLRARAAIGKTAFDDQAIEALLCQDKDLPTPVSDVA